MAACWRCWARNAPFPFTPSSPAPQQARQARGRPWGWPGLPDPARCSALLMVALSFLCSVHAVPPGTGRPGHLRADFCQWWALCPRILLGESPQGLGLLPGMLPSLLASRDPALFSPTVLCRWPFGMEMPNGWNLWLLHWCHPAHHPAGRPEGEHLNGTGSLVPAEARTEVLPGPIESDRGPSNRLQDKAPPQQTSLICQAALQSVGQRCPHPAPCLEKWGQPRRHQAHR